jgi:very-short-patch-repair endonuclease
MLKIVKERDEGRAFELQKSGISIIRFTNEEILYEMNTVLEKIKRTLKERIGVKF